MFKPLTAATLCAAVLALSACNVPPAPEVPNASASPSASPSAEPSPEPTIIPVPTPTPEPTPFPTGTPFPAYTPVPVPSASASGPAQDVNVRFRVAMINDSHQVLPVPDTEFTVYPYPLARIKRELAIRNNVEAMPTAPSQNASKYQIVEKVCTSSGCTEQTRLNNALFEADSQAYRETLLPNWEARAYRGLNDELAKVAAGREVQRVRTNANGEGSLFISTGMWYVNGTYTAGGTTLIWEDVAFDITPNTRTIDLIR